MRDWEWFVIWCFGAVLLFFLGLGMGFQLNMSCKEWLSGDYLVGQVPVRCLVVNGRNVN